MSDCGPDCSCKADVSRRSFLKVGATAAGLLAAGGKAPVRADVGYIPPEARVAPPREWFEALMRPGEPITYRGPQLANLIFPLGGIGTGTIWLHGSGRLVNWQIFNNIQKDSLVDDSFFAVRVEQTGRPPLVRVLRQQPLGPFPGIADVQFIGRYPVATLHFHDPDLPVDLELEAFNPLIPLDEQNSAIPCAIFTVRAINRTDRPVKVSLLASLQNAVGHPGAGAARGIEHTTYGGNRNRLVREEGITAVAMKADPGRPAQIDPPVELLVDHQSLPLLDDSPVAGLNVATAGMSKRNANLKSIYWLAGGDVRLLGGSVLGHIAESVRSFGAFLLLSGVSNRLLEPVEPSVGSDVLRRETVFASFDDQSYGRWTTEGNAFGERPATGTALNQNPISGFTGPGLINSYQAADLPQGRLTSPAFPIKERYISFLIGGGNHPGKCCLDLVVEGKVVRTETGLNTEQLRRVEWDVADLADREASLEVLDLHSEAWGHVLVDDIRFSNLPIDAVTAVDAEAWNEILEATRDADPMTAVGLGKGRVMRAPVELGTVRPGTDQLRQRDHVMSVLATLAGVDYQPAVGRPTTAPSFGTMCLASPDADCTVGVAWTDRKALFSEFMQTDRVDGGGSPPSADEQWTPPSPSGRTVNAALCRQLVVEPQVPAEAIFVFAWHFPNQYYPQQSWRPGGGAAAAVGNMYTNWFHDALSVAHRVTADLASLRGKTFAYREAMFDTTLPQYFIDAAAANVSILRSPSCFWTKAGTFYGFEGCQPTGGGCCPMNCNHVWNYEQTLAKLWPALERNMRITELEYNLREDRGIRHRVGVPREDTRNNHIPVADGQCGAVLKGWREHLQSLDRRFLDGHWELVRKAMDYVIERWDKDADGVMEQPQFNTYDRVIFGQNTFVSSLYLAALRAAEEMARLSNDENTAKRYRDLFEKGRTKIAETLFDGEYYIQLTDNLNGGYGKGCLSDQVVGAWWSCVLGLGDILPPEQVRSALKAIFRHNWLWTQVGFEGTQRFQQFADGTDKGLLCGSWPKGGRPEDPILYRDECWTGVEYQVAAHKIYEGQIEEALAIVRGVRERYEGVKRSPWNEIECGDYYVRALSSWSLLLAAQGYRYDGPRQMLAFDPQLSPRDHRSFFTTADGWGTFSQTRAEHRQTNRLAVAGGRCDLAELRFGLPTEAKSVKGSARKNDRDLVTDIIFQGGMAQVRFGGPITVQPGESIAVELEWM